MAAAEVVELFEQIKALPPHERLRLSANLLEAQKPEVAHAIAEQVVLELGAALALRKLRER